MPSRRRAPWIAAALLMTALGDVPYAQPVRQYAWEGPIVVTSTQPGRGDARGPLAVRWPHPAGSGSFVHRWTIQARWIEAGRTEVRDPQGHVTGTIVRLMGDHHEWVGQMSGALTSPCIVAEGCVPELAGPWTISISGQTAGSSRGIPAFVYFSSSSPDPLADVLPNGTFSMGPFSLQQVHGEQVMTPPPTCPRTMSACRPRTSQAHTNMPAPSINGHFNIGRWPPVAFFSPGGPASLTTDQVRARLTTAAFGVADTLNRLVIDDRVKGAYEARFPMGRFAEGWEVSWAVEWDLRKRLDVKSTLSRADRTWRPRRGESTALTATLDPAQALKGRFRFTLLDVTSEKGYAMNAGNETDLDLKFVDGQAGYSSPRQTSDGWQIETSDSAASATVRVEARDYGAWGRLEAEVNVDGEWYDCSPEGGGTSVTVPRDDDGNRIADLWEDNSGVRGQAAASDTETTPQGAGPGDGFTNYEEYRGFVVDGQWLATPADLKQLFLHDETGYGIGDFGKSDLFVYVIKETEFDGERVVNFNRGYATRGAQKGLRMVDAALDPGVMGEVPRVGTPNVVDEVRIDLSKHRLGSGMDTDELRLTIAHELGHAVNIFHHGDYEEGTCGTTPYGLVAVWGGAHAGDVSCIMRYDGADQYRDRSRRCHPYRFASRAPTLFCESRAGTGINAGPPRTENGQPLPVSGDATRGPCKRSIRLK